MQLSHRNCWSRTHLVTDPISVSLLETNTSHSSHPIVSQKLHYPSIGIVCRRCTSALSADGARQQLGCYGASTHTSDIYKALEEVHQMPMQSAYQMPMQSGHLEGGKGSRQLQRPHLNEDVILWLCALPTSAVVVGARLTILWRVHCQPACHGMFGLKATS